MIVQLNLCLQSVYENTTVVNPTHHYLYDCSVKSMFIPIPAGGGANLPPPLKIFLHNSKSIGLSLLKFSDFSYIPKALRLGLKPGFNTNCLSPQAHCLNDCFFV